MPNTVTDFWRMIWEKKLPTIVMLTKCFEGRVSELFVMAEVVTALVCCFHSRKSVKSTGQ